MKKIRLTNALLECAKLNLEGKDYVSGKIENRTLYLCDDNGNEYELADKEIEFQAMRYVQGLELILEEVFLNDDETENTPVNVYADEDSKTIYSVDPKLKTIRRWKLTDTQEIISTKHRHEILTYRLGKYTQEDEVSLGDIFMQGEFVKEI